MSPRDRNSHNISPPCCISPVKGVQIICVMSTVLGSFITFASWITSTYLDFESEEDLQILGVTVSHASVLLCIGMSQIASSVLMMLAKGNRNTAKIWTAFHIFSALATLFYLCNSISYTPQWNDKAFYTKYILSLLGFDFCFTVFVSLVMIEFLIQCPVGETSLLGDKIP